MDPVSGEDETTTAGNRMALFRAQRQFADYAVKFSLMYHIIGTLSLCLGSFAVLFRVEILSQTTGIPHDIILYGGLVMGTASTLMHSFLYKVKLHTTSLGCERMAGLLGIYLSGLETDPIELNVLRKSIIAELRSVNLLWYPAPEMGFEDDGHDADDAPRILAHNSMRMAALSM
jgi:hypothetical protein